MKKWTNETNRQFSREEVKMVNKFMKNSRISLIIKEMNIKITLSYQLTLVRIAIIRNIDNNKGSWGCRERGTLIYCWWGCKLVQPLWRAV
jgi:hypothetical protein